jgi:hypothetical protein
MNILLHSRILKPVFKCIQTFEINIDLIESVVEIKIELYSDISDNSIYKCRFYERSPFEMVEITEDGGYEGIHIINTSWDAYIQNQGIDFNGFHAKSTDEAIQILFLAINSYISHLTGVAS